MSPLHGSSGARLGALSICLVLALGPAPLQARERTHTVAAGQTLWSIAYQYGVRVEELMQHNGIDDPSRLQAGQSLRIPEVDRGRQRKRATRRRSAPALVWPLKGTLTSRYGRRRGRPHTGIDIAATKGTIIVAAASGRVVRGGDRWGRYGRVILLEHDGGRKTLYAHVSRSFVRPGERVRRGQAIAAVGATGNATGPHLHFEVWEEDRTVDPMRHLGRSDERTARLRR